MLTEVVDLAGGLAAGLLPLLLLAVPGVILFVVLPAILLLALALPFVVIGTVIAVPPYVLARRRRRRGVRAGSRPAGRRAHPALG
jgi:Flp pilus assembly protein TadB